MGWDKLSISVVVPVFNVAPYIERCVKSVISQTYQISECVLVNDASTDDSIVKIGPMIASYTGPTKFSILHHEKNRGLSAARNTGIDAASGDYLLFLDGDDELTKDCIEKLVRQVLKDETIEMVLGGFRANYSTSTGKCNIKDHDVRFVKKPLELRSNDDVRSWYYNKMFHKPDQVWNKLLKLSFIKENKLYNKEGQLFEDILWNYYLLRSLKHAVIIPDVTYVNYRRSGSIMTSTKYEEGLRHYGFIYREMAEHIVPGERIEETERWVWDFCHYYIDGRDNPDYQYAYKAFLQQFEDGGKRTLAGLMKMTYCFSGCKAGRVIVKSFMKSRIAIIKMIRYIIA